MAAENPGKRRREVDDDAGVKLPSADDYVGYGSESWTYHLSLQPDQYDDTFVNAGVLFNVRGREMCILACCNHVPFVIEFDDPEHECDECVPGHACVRGHYRMDYKEAMSPDGQLFDSYEPDGHPEIGFITTEILACKHPFSGDCPVLLELARRYPE